MRHQLLLCLTLAACGTHASDHAADDDDDQSADAAVITPDAGSPDATFQPACGEAPDRVPGPLCTDCSVTADETISADALYRNDAPSIALSSDNVPRVLYTSSVTFSRTYLASRAGDGSWTSDTLPMAGGLGALAFDSQGRELALIERGDVHTTLWRHDPAAWSEIDTSFPAIVGGWSSAFVRDTADCLHAVGTDPSEQFRPSYVVHDQAGWHARPLDEGPIGGWSFPASLALAPQGGAHALFWRSTGTDWSLTWAPPEGPLEPIASWGTNILDPHPLGLAITADGTRHALFEQTAPSAAHQLTYAVRAATGGWQLHSLGTGDSEAYETTCGPASGPPGRTCDFSMHVYRPLALVSSDVSVRVLYLSEVRSGTAEVYCIDPERCAWQAQPRLNDELRLAYLDGNTLETRPLVGGLAIQGARAVVDALGRIHLAFYAGDSEESSVRYLRIE